jgi:hypothetical protein
MTLYTTWLSTSFVRSYYRFAQAVQNLLEKKEPETVFRLFLEQYQSKNDGLSIYWDSMKIMKLQAFTTKQPVFAYTGLVYYNEMARRSLSKRAICSRDLAEFLSTLEKYLSENTYEANLSNNEFLEMYGITSKGDTSEKDHHASLEKY